MHRAKDEIHARGAEVVIVGNGAPHFARAFREDLGLTTPLYTDPTLATYRALEFRRGVVATLLSGRTWLHALRAMRAGFRQGRTEGDALQLGGVLVVRPDGEIAYRYASAEAGDHPPLADVLAALGPARPAAAAAGSGPAATSPAGGRGA
ncbi:hypothetical protein AMOR_26530 [Anaeromyxobacter oryzae]|uniref:Uncharacterized protein n=1 Tax=Anaeromyxobacter oryzae TaxID=2918170 RepID=A0ABM7WVY3_9BACT|nr:hypothetical protein AMOR_26530 [Anaeromyxobacter oryzae]